MSIERIKKIISFDSKAKIFTFGIVIGCLGGLIWQELFSPLEIPPMEMDRKQEIQLLRSDTNDRLLSYIEGVWSSSIGDLIIDIDQITKVGIITVIENPKIGPQSIKKYEVQNIETLDGFFGIVKLNICKSNSPCSPEELLPIQINKIFGIEKTVTISFDRRLSYCVDYDVICTRAFKRVSD